jgi:hypothetical protein
MCVHTSCCRMPWQVDLAGSENIERSGAAGQVRHARTHSEPRWHVRQELIASQPAA